jgi:hypothetical protein
MVWGERRYPLGIMMDSTAMRVRSGVVVLCLLVASGVGGVGQAAGQQQDENEGYEAIRARELPGLLVRLAEHAEWCKKKKLWLQRALAYEAILGFAPEDEVAHRGLGHKKVRDGSWAASKKARPIDRSKTDLAEALLRRVEVSGPFVDALQGLLEEHAQELLPQVRVRVFADILSADPDHAWTRRERYEVKHEGQWVMLEIANTATGRAEMVALEETTREELEPAPSVDFTTLEESLGLSLTAALAKGGVRVVGTVEESELKECVDHLRVVRTLFREHVGKRGTYSDDFTYFLLKNPSEQAVFLANHPKVTDADRSFFQGLESATITGARHFGSWSDEAERRLDSSCRQAISNLLYHGHKITAEEGWAFEGVGLYFTHVVVGSHLTWFVSQSRYMSAGDDAMFRMKLSDRDVDWLDEARALLEEGELPKFHTVVGREVNRLSTEDLLICNAAVAMLVEGRPGALPAILKLLGKGRSAHEAFLAELNLDLLQFDERLRTWLVETAD